MPSVIRNSQIEEAPDRDVDVELMSPSRLVGTHSNVVPMFSNTQSARLFYGGRFVNQAMPLANREEPLVQSLDPEDPDGLSFENKYGERMGARYFKDAEGVVTKVEPDNIEIKLPDGKKKNIGLYHNFQFNRKTQLSNTPQVKVGDKVKKGQILASSNFTDPEGTMAMGVNARVALVPFKGYSMDDAIVVSESFAKRLSSEHSYAHELSKEGDMKFGKTHYTALFPRQFTREQLDTLDDDGIVKPGTVLHKGDPIMLATSPKAISSNSHLGKLGKTFRQMRADAAEVWEHDYPGTVADSVNGKKHMRVFVNATVPMRVGDKMIAGRQGQKCYHPDTEVLTDRGWKRIGEVTLEDNVASLFESEPGKQDFFAKFVHPIDTTSYQFNGELYGFENTSVSYLVTGNHRIWAKTPSAQKFKVMLAENMFGKNKQVMTAAHFDLSERTVGDTFTIPFVEHTKSGRPSSNAENRNVFPLVPFVKFLAFYLCEGNIKPEPDHSVIITQKERPFCREIEHLFDELGFVWKRIRNQYRICSNKSLATYLRQFGHANQKFIPEWIFSLPKELIREFVNWAWQGDGGKYEGNCFYSSSFKMIEGMQLLLTLLGYRTRWTKRDKRSHQNYDSYTLTRFRSNMYANTSAGNAFRGREPEKGHYKQQYNGSVYCVQVPGLGVILTRHNGKIMWNGNSIISKVIPDEQMLRSLDGKPFEVLLNPLALPSRVNTATPYELALGKLAMLEGKPIKVPAFTKPGSTRLNQVLDMLKKKGVSDTEEVFDPMTNRKLEKPVTTGVSYMYKLHHVVESKISARGQGAYDSNDQPVKGGSEGAQAKRLGGLETTALMAHGAYATLREGATLRGSRADDYWRLVRQGYTPAEPGKPFVWHKFKALLNGAGYNPRDLGKGTLRLSPFTDKDLEDNKPIELQNARSVNLGTLEPEKGGLFDASIVAGNRWGKITLPSVMPNPAFEKQIQQLLGITNADMRKVIAGEMTLKEAQANKTKK